MVSIVDVAYSRGRFGTRGCYRQKIIKIEWYVQVVNEYSSEAIKSYSERQTLKDRHLLELMNQLLVRKMTREGRLQLSLAPTKLCLQVLDDLVFLAGKDNL